MKIIVFDIAAEVGGALKILDYFYFKAQEDIDNEWVFILSIPERNNTDNIQILRYPWIKKSWLHRIFFDYFIAGMIVRKNRPDQIISLQNIMVKEKGTHIPQTIYVHQALALTDYKFSLKESPLLWAYQNPIGKMIRNSIRRADKIIVQTKWMKEACVQKTGCDPNKIVVEFPNTNIRIKKAYQESLQNAHRFFYPAGSEIYKNHLVILKALIQMKRRNMLNNIKVYFTLEKNESRHTGKLWRIVQENGLPVEFKGELDIAEVYKLYSCSTLLFPSYLESFGLPMLEARQHKAPVIASNCSFSHELLDGYEKALFFDPFNDEQLAECIIYSMQHIEQKDCKNNDEDTL